MKKPSKNVVKEKYDYVRERRLKGSLLVFFLGILIVISGFAALSMLSSLTDQTLLSNLWWNVPLFFGTLIPIIILFKKQPKYLVENKDSIFFVFYDLYHNIEEFTKTLESRDDKQPTFGSYSYFKFWIKYLLMKRSFNVLKIFVEGWSYSKAPLVFREIPESISKNLGEKISRIIENKDRVQLNIYSQILKSDCELLCDKEATLEDWKTIRKHLEDLAIKIEEAPKKIKPKIKLNYHFLLKPYVNFFLIFGILLTSMLYFNNNPGLSIAISAGASFGGSAYIEAVKKNRAVRNDVK